MSATTSPRAASLAELQGAFQDFVLASSDSPARPRLLPVQPACCALGSRPG